MKFKEPIRPKSRKTSATFAAPKQSKATTGYFMPAGDDYGVGFRQPVGKDKATSDYAIPLYCKMFKAEQALDESP